MSREIQENGRQKYEVLSYEQITSDMIIKTNETWYNTSINGFKFYSGCKPFTKTNTVNKMLYDNYYKAVLDFNKMIDFCEQVKIENYDIIEKYCHTARYLDRIYLIDELKDYLGVKQ